MGIRSRVKGMAKSAIDSAVAKAEAGRPRGPEDPEAYAAEVAESIKGDVRMFSGCTDDQVSSDLCEASSMGAGGACTNALVDTLNADEGGTWLSVLKGMQARTDHLEQVPQLSTSGVLDIHDKFFINNPNGSGRTRSLLIGINYVGQGGELSGCHNDAITMKNYILTHGYQGNPSNCRVLMDDGEHETPDRNSILAGFRWLVEGAEAGDSLFFLYSGHGAYVEDTSGDEVDGMDETLCPVDYHQAGIITDDTVFEELVLPLVDGVTLTVVMDSCHSGSALDLPYQIKADEGTIAAVESGKQSSIIGSNPKLGKLILFGKNIYDIYENAGKTGTAARAAASH